DKQYVIVSIFFTELCHCKLAAGLTCFQSLDKFVRKSLACDIENIFRRIVLQDKVGDGMHKMRLAKPDTSIDEKWIICLSGRFCNCQGGSVRKAVIAANYKCVKRIFWI